MDGQHALPFSGKPGVPRTAGGSFFFDVLNSMERNQAPLTTIECRAGRIRYRPQTDGFYFFVDLSLLRVGSHEHNSFFTLIPPRSFYQSDFVHLWGGEILIAASKLAS